MTDDYKRAYVQAPSGEVSYERAAADDRAAFTEARDAGKAIHQAQRLENATYTAVEMNVLTEAALRLGRTEAAEEIAAKCLRRAQLAERVPEGERSGVREGMVLTWLEAERLAREIASKENE